MESDGTIHSRWQGQWLTGYDYELMTPGERERLTIEQLNQIDANLIYELGLDSGMPETDSEKDTADQTESETESGRTDRLESEVAESGKS